MLKFIHKLIITTKQDHKISYCCLILLSILMYGCATSPTVIPVITINTIPDGADISVQGNYIGKSPTAFPRPDEKVSFYEESGRSEYGSYQPLEIEAQLTGYETKKVSLGIFHPSIDKIIQPVFSSSAVVKTIPGYYTFPLPNQITIKLYPLQK
jgi:PEGA domain-containing protein